MALRDTLKTLLSAEIKTEAAKGKISSASFSVFPANGTGDWSEGFKVSVTTDKGFSWTSGTLPGTVKPDCDAILEELKEGITREINRRASR